MQHCAILTVPSPSQRQLCYRPFIEWAVETKDAIRLSQVAKMIFKKAVDKLKLTPQAVMAFFNVRPAFPPCTLRTMTC